MIFYPAPAGLVSHAEAQVRRLGAKPVVRPPMGGKTAALARVLRAGKSSGG